MKTINLNISANGDKKTFKTKNKIYTWERVEVAITGVKFSSASLLRAALYDGDTQVVCASNFSIVDDVTYCIFLLRTEALMSAMEEIVPNKAKKFTLYLWDDYEEEVTIAGNLPIYKNPYIGDEIQENVEVTTNIKINYSVDGVTWTDEVPENAIFIRFSADGGTKWDNPIRVGSSFKVQYSSDGERWYNTPPASCRMIRISTDNGKTYDDPIIMGNTANTVIEEVIVFDSDDSDSITPVILDIQGNEQNVYDDGNMDGDEATHYRIDFAGYVLNIESYVSSEAEQTDRMFVKTSYDGSTGITHMYFTKEEYESISTLANNKNIVKIQYLQTT